MPTFQLIEFKQFTVLIQSTDSNELIEVGYLVADQLRANNQFV